MGALVVCYEEDDDFFYLTRANTLALLLLQLG